MALLELTDTPTEPGITLKVVLCGSFRKDPAGLAQTYAALRAHFTVLSPTGLDFLDPAASFVRLPHEVDAPAAEIEASHLDAMTASDFVWLHAPGGYVGT